MRERPMLFQDAMVRAILAGQKTQTRRLVKGGQVPVRSDDGRWTAVGQPHPRWGFCVSGETEEACADELGRLGRCPYGQPGDRLWVREAHYIIGDVNGPARGIPWTHYRADLSNNWSDQNQWEGPWKPSIHMPRRACRLVLEIVSVRVERLQDISEADAIAEGWPKQSDPGADTGGNGGPFDWYRLLWEQINGGGSWAANPWVWVVEFRKVQP